MHGLTAIDQTTARQVINLLSTLMKAHHPLRSFLLLASSSLLAISSASAQSWDGSSNGDWLTGANWTGDVAAGSTTSTDTDIAVFNVNANNTIGINMTTAGGNYYLGAIDNTNATARVIQNTSGTTGVLTLNGATVNSVANTILRNSASTLLTIGNSASGTLGLALGNATSNVIQITGAGGITINSIIRGSNGITTQGGGAGALTLAGSNTYTGVTAISNSTVTVSNANGLGSNTGGNHTTIAYTGGQNGTGGRLLLSGGITVAENITITGNDNTGNAGYVPAIGSSSGTNTFSGTITLTGTGAGNVIRLGVGTTIFSGTITQTGMATALGLQGTTTVNNPITINGGAVTVIGGSSVATLSGVSGSGIGTAGVAQGGTLVLGVTNALNTNANLTIGTFGGTDSGTVSLNGFDQTVRALTSSSTTIQSGTRIVRNNSASRASTLTVGNGGGSGTFNGTIVNGAAATLALVKTGAGTQTLVNTNTYTGGTSINEGTLTLGHASDTLANNGAVNINGGTLALGTNSDTVGAVTLTSGSITSSTGVLTGSSYDVRSGSVSAILGGSGIALTKTTGDSVTLSGTNTYTGGTSIDNGTLTLGHATDTLANTGAVNVNGGTLALGSNNDTVGAVTLTSGSITGSGTLTGTVSAYDVRSGTISAKLGGTVGLTKTTGGTVTLSGINTYTGATTVSAGTLVVNGNISTSSLLTVDTGATLAGSGTVGATIVNGTLSVGNSPGTMVYTNTLTLAGSTIMEIDGTAGAGLTNGHDFINLTGAGAAGVLTYGGTMTLDIGTLFGIGTYSWDLFNMASETGTFTSISLADLYSGNLLDTDLDGIWDLTSDANGFTNSWTFNESSGSLNLNVAAIPEPRAALLGGIGMLLLLRRRRG